MMRIAATRSISSVPRTVTAQSALLRQRCFATTRDATTSALLQHVTLERLAHQSKLHLQIGSRGRTDVEVVPVLAASEFALNAFGVSGRTAAELYDVQFDEQTDDSSNSIASVRITRRADTDDEPTRLQLLLPHMIDLNVSVARGDVYVRDKIEGDTAIVVGDGDIHVHKLRGTTLKLQTNRGAVDVASLLEGERVHLAAGRVTCKRLMAGAADIKLHKSATATSTNSADASTADASISRFGAIYSAACVIQSVATAGASLEVESVHGYLRVASDALAHIHIHSVSGALDVADSSAHCTALVHFDAWTPDARSSIAVGGDARVSVAPSAATLAVELHGRTIATDSCVFQTVANEQLDDEYTIVTGVLQATATGSTNSSSRGTTGKINASSAKDAAMRTSFFMADADASSSDSDDNEDDDRPQLLVHATGGSVQLEQLDWMAKLKRKHLVQQEQQE